MLRGGHHPRPQHNRVLKALTRTLPATGHLHGQRFFLRDRGQVLATPLLLALIAIETTDVVFAADSIPAILAVTTDLRDLVRSYLERAGFTVLSTGSGAEAITMAADASPDLVVLDLRLPDVPGETVARELRAVAATPILMLTAKSAAEDRISGLESAPTTRSPSRSVRGNWSCGSKRSCAAASRPSRRRG